MRTHYFVGSGIASLAGAAYLIRDGNVSGENIVIFEQAREFGGALDSHGTPEAGYFMSGSRMFEHQYKCTFDLLSFIPSISNPELSIKEELDEAVAEAEWNNKARLVNNAAVAY
jgi:oleate hydratase